MLPHGSRLRAGGARPIIGLYLLKGLGAYFSDYLMADVGQRVVRDLRNQLLPAHPRPVGGVLRAAHDRAAAVAHHQRRRPGAAARSPRRSATCCAKSLALVGYAALLFYYDARLALVCLTGAPLVVYPLVRLGQRVRRTTRRSQEALEHLSHVAAEAFTGHRIVKAFGAEEREAAKFERASRAAAIAPT